MDECSPIVCEMVSLEWTEDLFVWLINLAFIRFDSFYEGSSWIFSENFRPRSNRVTTMNDSLKISRSVFLSLLAVDFGIRIHRES